MGRVSTCFNNQINIVWGGGQKIYEFKNKRICAYETQIALLINMHFQCQCTYLNLLTFRYLLNLMTFVSVCCHYRLLGGLSALKVQYQK